MNLQRSSGILLHPTSLPGEFGIGDLGPAARSFCDLLAEAGQTYWQILPLGPTGYGDSPYQCFSAFAGNTLLISPEELIADGLVDGSAVADLPEFTMERVDFGAVYDWKGALLPLAYDGFRQNGGAAMRPAFETFCRENDFWLADYALFRSIKAAQSQNPWYEWPVELRLRDAGVLSNTAEELTDEVLAEKFYQFIFFKQWSAVKQYANELGIRIIGDIPIFAALDSSDVWCNQEKFKLNPDGTARRVSGVPPDYFSETGQLWGNPIYDWRAMQQDGFRWWAARVHSTLRMVDIARLDHFRGFVAAWEVPGGDQTAENGQWVEVPGPALFETLRSSLGELPLIAEDLGDITPEVRELQDSLGIPGMRILQFAFGGDAANHDLPHNYIGNCVAYTGTHDNDTAVGWFSSLSAAADKQEEVPVSRDREYCLKYLDSGGEEINWDMLRAVWGSVAHLAITPMQDLLGIGSEGRMNLPATDAGNWSWRMIDEAFTPDIRDRLLELTRTYGRMR